PPRAPSPAGTRPRPTHRSRGSTAQLPLAPGANLLERASRGPAQIDGLAPCQPGAELLALDLARHGFEDHVAHRAPSALRVGPDLALEALGNVLHLQVRHGMLIACHGHALNRAARTRSAPAPTACPDASPMWVIYVVNDPQRARAPGRPPGRPGRATSCGWTAGPVAGRQEPPVWRRIQLP